MYLARSDSSFDGAVGDFNGDGIDDIFVANRDQQNEVLLADGQGDFTSTLLARSDSSYGGVVGDFNGDGIDDIFVANRGQHNEYLWYDPCSDDGFFYDAPTRGCYACPRYTTDTRHSVSRCEACPAGTIGPGQALKHDQRVFCIPCEAGKTRALEQTECTLCPVGRFAGSGAPSCEPCQAPLVTNAEGDGATGCITCSPGKAPNEDMSGCVDCTGTTYSQFGFECQECDDVVGPNAASCNTCLNTCQAGEGQNTDNTACQPCTGTQYSITGQCQDCAAPNVVSPALR